MTEKHKKVLMQGNIALCEGAIAAGVEAYFGYPITPQNEVAAHMSRRMVELNRVFLQAESELAAINMVFGVALTGKRAMTSSSSPGISLMQEGISYLCGCELPCAITNVTRGGPGLGNIAGSQADYFQATKGGGHGDYRMITLAPASVQEMFDFSYVSFELAEKYRNPVMILSDGYVGQMMEPVMKATMRPLGASSNKSWALDGCAGRSPRKIRSLIMGEGELEEHNWHLKSKYDGIQKNETLFETHYTDGAEILVVAFGIVARICLAAIEMLRSEKHHKRIGFVRPITLWPFPSNAVAEAAKHAKKVFVAELNIGQMVEDVRLAVNGKAPVEFAGKPGGTIFSTEEIYERIRNL
jgi:2-oxoglutarate ferredoxin oxidoreductase subunit alpha